MTDLVVRRSAVVTMGYVRDAGGHCASWYADGMKLDSRIRDLPTLPLHSEVATGEPMLSRDQRLELERRREFVRSLAAARNRVDGKGQEIDPVLAFHLGLQKPHD